MCTSKCGTPCVVQKCDTHQTGLKLLRVESGLELIQAAKECQIPLRNVWISAVRRREGALKGQPVQCAFGGWGRQSQTLM
jgi:hypothetical protein